MDFISSIQYITFSQVYRPQNNCIALPPQSAPSSKSPPLHLLSRPRLFLVDCCIVFIVRGSLPSDILQPPIVSPFLISFATSHAARVCPAIQRTTNDDDDRDIVTLSFVVSQAIDVVVVASLSSWRRRGWHHHAVPPRADARRWWTILSTERATGCRCHRRHLCIQTAIAGQRARASSTATPATRTAVRVDGRWAATLAAEGLRCRMGPQGWGCNGPQSRSARRQRRRDHRNCRRSCRRRRRLPRHRRHRQRKHCRWPL